MDNTPVTPATKDELIQNKETCDTNCREVTRRITKLQRLIAALEAESFDLGMEALSTPGKADVMTNRLNEIKKVRMTAYENLEELEQQQKRWTKRVHELNELISGKPRSRSSSCSSSRSASRASTPTPVQRGATAETRIPNLVAKEPPIIPDASCVTEEIKKYDGAVAPAAQQSETNNKVPEPTTNSKPLANGKMDRHQAMANLHSTLCQRANFPLIHSKIPTGLPKFDPKSKPESIRDFLERYSRTAATSLRPHQWQLGLFPAFDNEQVDQIIIDSVQADETFQQTADRIIAKYETSSEVYNAKQTLYNTKQRNGEKVEELQKRMRSLAATAHMPIDSYDVLEAFHQSLFHHSLRAIAYQHIQLERTTAKKMDREPSYSFDDMVRDVKDQERQLHDNNSKGKYQGTSKYSNSNSGNTNTTAQEQKQEQKHDTGDKSMRMLTGHRKDSDKPSKKCSICGNTNHNDKNCWKKMSTGPPHPDSEQLHGEIRKLALESGIEEDTDVFGHPFDIMDKMLAAELDDMSPLADFKLPDDF